MGLKIRPKQLLAGITQIGFDSLALGGNTLPPDASGQALVVDSIARVIRVVLPDITPGNFLEVDYDITAELVGNPTDALVGFVPIVSFDGSTTVPGTFFYVLAGSAGASISVAGAGVAGATVHSTMGIPSLFEIPADSTIATVELVYVSSVNILMPGWLAPPAPAAGGCNLIVREWERGTVAQPGPPDPLFPVAVI